jgi:glutathione S-transferase
MSTIILHGGAIALGGAFLESKFGSKLTEKINAFALTPIILIGFGLWTSNYGFTVGSARAKYMELAEKDGEENVKERYGLPNLYAQGTSIHARAFNCVQRAHQQIFESFPQVIVSSLTGAVTFPLATAASTIVYVIGRRAMSNSYAAGEGDASKRYSSVLSGVHWKALVGLYFLGLASGTMILMDKQKKLA